MLPGVTVTVTQTDTGFTRTTVTDEDGAYVLPNLPLGPYRLEVMLAGFRTYAQTGIVLQVGATPAINVGARSSVSSPRPSQSRRPRRWWTRRAQASARSSSRKGSSSCRFRDVR